MKQYREDLEFFLKKTYFMAFLILLSVVGYGFSISHPTINVDTLVGDYYIGSGQIMLRAGRFGHNFWSAILGYGPKMLENHFVIGLFAVIMLVWAALNFCILFRRASNDTISVPAYLVFSSFLITHPIMTEIWEYQGANVLVCGGYLFVSFSLLALYTQLDTRKFSSPRSLFALFCMTIVCSSYESLVTVYIFFVFGTLYLQQRQAPDWKRYVIYGLIYCSLLILAILSRLLIHQIILRVLDLTPTTNGATEIAWLDDVSKLEILTSLIRRLLYYHICYGILYYPLTISLIFGVCLFLWGIVLLIKKKVFSGLLVMGMVLSLELMSLLTGTDAPYRICQVFAAMCAFTAMLVANRIRWKHVLAVLLCYVCLHQAVYLNSLATLNYMRYEEEMVAVDTIGHELTQYDQDKEVIFVGDYPFSQRITDQLFVSFDSTRWKIYSHVCTFINQWISDFSYLDYQRNFPDTNVQSVLGWSTLAFGAEEYMQKLFSLRGYDLNITSNYSEDMEMAKAYLLEQNTPSYPTPGYIVELDDLIIVRLGPIY